MEEGPADDLDFETPEDDVRLSKSVSKGAKLHQKAMYAPHRQPGRTRTSFDERAPQLSVGVVSRLWACRTFPAPKQTGRADR